MSWAKRLRSVPMQQAIPPMRMEVFLPSHLVVNDATIISKSAGVHSVFLCMMRWNEVVDSFIPARVSRKAKKKYAFVLLSKVKNVEQKQHVRVNVPVSSSFSRFFAAAVSNDVHHHKNEKLMEDKLVIVIDEDCLSDKNSELNLVAKVKTFDSMPNLRIIFKDEGFEYVTIRYLGGFWVSLEFTDIHARDSFKRHEGMDTWFFVIQPWKNDFRVDERVLWVDVEGIPLVAWTNKTFMKIAKRWGELGFTEDSDDNDLWRKRPCVVTKVKDFIIKSIGIKSFLMLFGVTAALIDVNVAQSKLVVYDAGVVSE
ncbi:RNA-directed DNA polymerase, eukaryota [Tanacetum coccineum]